MIYVYISFYIFVFLKQFYFFKSGGIQPGDIFFLLSFILILFRRDKVKGLRIRKIDNSIIMFTGFVICINLFYAVIYGKVEFLSSTFHYIFILLLVILFRELIEDDRFNTGLLKVLKVNLISQLLIFITNTGRSYMGIRYMGSFNDPNQLAFFIYSTLMLIVLISKVINKKVESIYHLIAIFLIFKSSSTGMFLALTIFYSFNVIYLTIKRGVNIRIKRKSVIIYILLINIACIFIANNYKKIDSNFVNIPIIQRVKEKIKKIGNEGDGESYDRQSIIQERSIDKLLLYPEQMIWGAGQGYYARFDKAAYKGEIHSTLPSIAFCYGIIPTILIIIWIMKNIKGVSIEIYIIIMSLVIESFVLLNQRQPFFWMIFILSYLYKKKNSISMNVY